MAVEEISIAAFVSMHNPSLRMVDVREADEYESGHIPGAVNIPLSEFAARVSEVGADKVVYMICRSGARSMQACEICIDSDINSVKNVAGGTMGWIASGRDIVTGELPG
jgi:rhodanese-related sulfurtransferase